MRVRPRHESQSVGNEANQGVKATTFFVDLKFGYLVNPRTNLRLELGYTYRRFDPELEVDGQGTNTTNFFHIGLVSSLNNFYYDF